MIPNTKRPHVMHFNVPRDWFETNLRHQKRYSEDSKKICECRSLMGRVISSGEAIFPAHHVSRL